MDNPVVVEARKYLDTVNFIVDLYDNSFVWASDDMLHLAGYTLEEFTKRRMFDSLDKSVNQQEVRKRLAEDMAKKHGTIQVLSNTKTGTKVNLHLEFYVFEFDHGWYMTAKTLKAEKLP